MNKVYRMADHSYYINNYAGQTIAINGGDDDYLAVAYDNDASESMESAKGDTQHNVKVIQQGTITISKQWGDPENEKLNQLFYDQQNGKYCGAGVIKRQTQTENTDVWKHTNNTMIKTIAPDNLKSTGGARVWVLTVEKLTPEERDVSVG